MKQLLMLLLFMTQVGCGGFAQYTIMAAGTLTGNVLSETYENYQKELIKIEKGEKDDKNDN
ncbi:MAG TPA: hypothetical protein EYG21_00810 [Nitrospinaceae bacterium]|jgi:hypothetical protein|nr:hypothetical protein [Nitrospinaceae bacterium]